MSQAFAEELHRHRRWGAYGRGDDYSSRLRATFTPMPKNPTRQDSGASLIPAMELLLNQGYNSTSVSELADAAGISRSTFFRRFKSKEDLVFADHERLLSRVKEDLSNISHSPLKTVSDAALWVFEQHVRNRQLSLVRSRLLRQVQTLRDRELVTRHRYERLFFQHLEDSLSLTEDEVFAAVGFASAVVAVHNRALLQWLREADGTSGLPEKMNTDKLDHHLQSLIDIFSPSILPSHRSASARPTVVVTILDPQAKTEEIVEAVKVALG